MKVTVNLSDDVVKELRQMAVKTKTGSMGRSIEYMLKEIPRLENYTFQLNNLLKKQLDLANTSSKEEASK